MWVTTEDVPDIRIYDHFSLEEIFFFLGKILICRKLWGANLLTQNSIYKVSEPMTCGNLASVKYFIKLIWSGDC